jgi:hypothetical protein
VTTVLKWARIRLDEVGNRTKHFFPVRIQTGLPPWVRAAGQPIIFELGRIRFVMDWVEAGWRERRRVLARLAVSLTWRRSFGLGVHGQLAFDD